MPIKLNDIIFLISLLFVALPITKAGERILIGEKVKHNIKVPHPGKKLTQLPRLQLIEYKQKNGTSDSYSMDVVSVYCDAEVCKVDTIQMRWNMLGDFVKYTLPPSIELEKAEGKPFTKGDYNLLQNILLDKNSPFKGLQIDDIVSSDQAHIGGLDAYSGATTLQFEEGASVEGAALTCYTLWHWAHGKVVDLMRELTGNNLSIEQLQTFWKSEDTDQQYFALEQFIRRKEFDDSTLALIKNTIDQRSAQQQKLLISYLELSTEDVYFRSILEFFEKASSNQRINYLNSLINTRKETTSSYYDEISTFLPLLDSYQEVNLMLSLMDSKNQGSDLVNLAVVQLLKEDIFKARRAYWFLSEQDLSKDQQKKVNRFYRKNQDYL